jgi:DNA polymerase-1
MNSFDLTLAGQPVVVHAPAPGEFDVDQARQMWRQLISDTRRVIGLDVETTAHDTKLSPPALHWAFGVRLVQFGAPESAWVLRMDDPDQRSAAEAILRDERLRFCSHTRYDAVAVWREFGVDITDRSIDTRLLARIANPLSLDRHDKKGGAEAVDLKSLTANLLTAPELGQAEVELKARFAELWRESGGKGNVGKTVIERSGWNTIGLDEPVYLRYAGLDAIACRRLYPVLVANSQSTPELLATETWLAGLVTRMQMRGMRVDKERLDAEFRQAEQACKVPEQQLHELVGLTPRQNVKLVAWFKEHGVDFNALGHPTTKSGAPSLDGDALPLMADYDLDPESRQVVDLLLAYKEQLNTMSKAEEILGLVDDSFDGRLHPSVDSLGAITARMTSAAPNIQNYAKADPRMRATLLPDEGHILIGADFDTVELRVLAALSQEQAFLDTIHSGGDLHQLTADKIGVDRQVGKRVNFLQAYGGGATPLAKATGISVDEALAATRAYREAYPAIAVYSRKLQQSNEVRTLTHRRIPATYISRDGTREAATFRFLNYMIQSSSRDLLVMALHRLAEFGMAEMLWVPIHDELILQVPADRLDECISKLEEAMRMALLGVPITATAVALIDEEGVSRWMTCDRAEKVAEVAA